MSVAPGELVIVRFGPFLPDRLAEQAQAEADRLAQDGLESVPSISAFGLPMDDSTESLDDLIKQICREAPVNGKTVSVTTKTELEESGYSVRLSEPPPNHYDVVVGLEPGVGDTETLAALFNQGRRKNPAWEK